ncbi:MAG: M23 family metallopeptidase, partial [Candidatus Bipolaricaulia bacterium]
MRCIRMITTLRPAQCPSFRPAAQMRLFFQESLYGEGDAVYKGVDFSAGVDFGDSVYAVADGRGVDVQDQRPNNCHPTEPGRPRCPVWGNYVLIQHDERHYDRTEGQMAYVYSLNLHLQQNHVFVAEGQNVNQGDLIAQADNTGNSYGDHLHLQIMLHPEANREIEPLNTLESETRSRNPEPWLNPYPNTATAIGKVTDADGNAVR